MTFEKQAYEYVTKLADLCKKNGKGCFIGMYIQNGDEAMQGEDYCSFVQRNMSYFDSVSALSQINYNFQLKEGERCEKQQWK